MAFTTQAVNQHPRNNLDALRLLFASLVLLSHSPELIDGNRNRELLSIVTGNVVSFGEFAVQGFFALSGYLIMASWTRQPQLVPYFRNRVLRIYPGFIIAFCVSVLIVGPLAAPDRSTYFAQFSLMQFMTAISTLHDPWFAKSFPLLHHQDVNAAMWTISYEFVCYVLVAATGLLTRTYLRFTWLALTAVLLLFSCFITELKPIPQISRFYVDAFVRMSAPFFVGASLYLIGFKGIKMPFGISAAGFVFLITLFSTRYNVFGFALFGTAFFLSVGLATSQITLMRKWPDISYGTYLYGWPVIQLLIWSLPGLEPWSIFSLSLLLSLGCGYVSWVLVEAPFMRLKSRASSGHVLPVRV